MARVLLLAKYNVRGEKSLKSLNIRRMKMGVMSWTFSLYYFSFTIRELFFKGQLQLHWISFLTVIAFLPPTHIILPPIVNALVLSSRVFICGIFPTFISLGPLHRTARSQFDMFRIRIGKFSCVSDEIRLDLDFSSFKCPHTSLLLRMSNVEGIIR